MVVGGYTLDLYCDCQSDAHKHGEFPHQFFGETYSGTSRQAKRQGWKITKDRSKAICPKCVSQGLKPKEENNDE